MKEYIKNGFKLDLFYGILHALIAFTSITVVATISGIPLTNAFLFAGVGTLILKLITKGHGIPIVFGCSGSYIGAMLAVGSMYGSQYVQGGIISAGIIYLIIGLLMLKFQDKILNIIPKWILNVSVILIALNLLPIGTSLIGENIIVAVVTIACLILFNRTKNPKVKMFAVPLSILLGTIYVGITNGLDFSVLSQELNFVFNIPKFNIPTVTMIGITCFCTLGEVFGDTSNTSAIVGKDFIGNKQLAKIVISNGVATMVSGVGNGMPSTSYGENSSLLLITKYFKPTAQIITGITFILLSLFTPLLKIFMLIPSSVLGAVAMYLYATFCINSIKELSLNADLNNSKQFTIIAVMIAIFFTNVIIQGVQISSIGLAFIVGIVLNKLMKDRKETI